MTKQEVLQEALALNGADKKYQITVEDDTIITRVKWMDATFFSPDEVTDEMQGFEYIVRVFDNGKYTELDKSVEVTQSVNSGGVFNWNKSISFGKQIMFSKSIGFGKDHQTGETGIISHSFYSEEYKQPVRTILKEAGYKKKMGTLGKTFLISGIATALVVIAVVLLMFVLGNKNPISIAEFEKQAVAYGYQVSEDMLALSDNQMEANRIAMDMKDEYRVELYDFSDAEFAQQAFSEIKSSIDGYLVGEKVLSSGEANLFGYQNYSVSTDHEYIYLARVDDTVLLTCTEIAHKGEAETFIDAIGY